MKNLKTYLSKYNKKILIRLKKLKGTPYSVAAGFACGVAVSFTPFVGFHMILAAISASVLRGNIISSQIGTLIGNPWTFPFIWAAVLYTGSFLSGGGAVDKVDFLQVFDNAGKALITFNFKNFGRDVWPIIYPMIIGCIPYCIISWLMSYKLIKSAMNNLQKRCLNRLKPEEK